MESKSLCLRDDFRFFTPLCYVQNDRMSTLPRTPSSTTPYTSRSSTASRSATSSLQCAFTPLAEDLKTTKTDKKHSSRQESHPLLDRPEIELGLAGPEYHAIISFGLPVESEDCQYGESRFGQVRPNILIIAILITGVSVGILWVLFNAILARSWT